MAWKLAPALVKLREQVNREWPNRSTRSDGTLGDTAHQKQGSASDHNPWISKAGIGIVTAFDITHDPNSGADMNVLADVLINNNDQRVKYVIWNRRIWITPYQRWQKYEGSDPHTDHLHISVSARDILFENGSDWIINVAKEKEENMATLVDKSILKNMAVKAFYRQATEEELNNLDGKEMLEVYRAWFSSENPERKNIERLIDLGIQADKEGFVPGKLVAAQETVTQTKATIESAVTKAKTTAPAATKSSWFIKLLQAITFKS